jgi:hypothetical protein
MRFWKPQRSEVTVDHLGDLEAAKYIESTHTNNRKIQDFDKLITIFVCVKFPGLRYGMF